MINVHFEGAEEIGKPPNMRDEDCSSAWAMKLKQELTDTEGNTIIVPFFLMAYQPSKEDIEAIVAGQPIYLKIQGHRLAPHALWTHNPVTNDPNF